MGLSDLASRSGERHSPRRGREETEPFCSAISRPGEMYWGSERQGARLGENSPKRGCDEK